MSFADKRPEMQKWIDEEWDRTCVPVLQEYITIPNQSPAYDPEERKNGLTEKAFKLLIDWAKAQELEGMTMQFHEAPGKTPLLTMVVEPRGEAQTKGTMLMYGHMDKQPPMTGWDEDLGPYKPVMRDGKLYGRGGADDGYAICACVTAVKATQRAGLPHGRIVILIEASEESGSHDLPFWIEKCRDLLGNIDLIVCTDSGAIEFDTVYMTQTLRGIVGGTLNVSLLKCGVHSGIQGGIVPDAFRVSRMLLERIEDTATGEIKLEALHSKEAPSKRRGFDYIDKLPGAPVSAPIPTQPGVQVAGSESDMAFRNSWLPCLTVTGCDLPKCEAGGNVLHPKSSLKLSIRIPPGLSPEAAVEAVRHELERDPPFGAKVDFKPDHVGAGWAAPPLADWLRTTVEQGAQEAFGLESRVMGVGGSIPFMGMLGAMYPDAQFFVTGVLGPETNAHGPNEFLHVPYTKKFVGALTRVVNGHAVAPRETGHSRAGEAADVGCVKRDKL
eukprot:TRINITY_DN8975_c0_g1_i1.p1 TRINITY_DN8975_c0_g1~~TRINITY_DN8975_c0_g1_i1.p1  ORF type:complete len:528 (+),score=225.93 TRINITY_DN8975_c0_g1_i1:91-1584(+)